MTACVCEDDVGSGKVEIQDLGGLPQIVGIKVKENKKKILLRFALKIW